MLGCRCRRRKDHILGPHFRTPQPGIRTCPSDTENRGRGRHEYKLPGCRSRQLRAGLLHRSQGRRFHCKRHLLRGGHTAYRYRNPRYHSAGSHQIRYSEKCPGRHCHNSHDRCPPHGSLYSRFRPLRKQDNRSGGCSPRTGHIHKAAGHIPQTRIHRRRSRKIRQPDSGTIQGQMHRHAIPSRCRGYGGTCIPGTARKRFEDTAYFEPFYLKEFIAADPSRKIEAVLHPGL